MDREDDRALLRVAEAVNDGRPVHWEAETSTHRNLGGRLRQFRLIERIAAAHQTATPEAWGPLRILEPIGRGGFGEIYRAYDPALRREVALKLLRPRADRKESAEARSLEEARRLARVRHPNVLTVHGADRHEGRVGLWTDLLRGKTLEETLAEQGPLGAAEAALIGVDLCRALAAVHAAGLVHCDVKTSNVLREQGGRIVLLDFGSVREGIPGGGRDELQDTGTPLFMAPELLRGEAPRPGTDVYGLGVVLFRLVTGRFPVEASTLDGLIDKHRLGRPPALRDLRPDLPAAFVQAVGRALERDPARRYAGAGELEAALLATIAPGAVARAPIAPGREGATPPRRLARRGRLWVLAAAGITLVVAALAALLPRLTPAPLSVEASLYREREGIEERLSPGARIRPGDRLFMEVEGSESMHFYVLNEDERMRVLVLFPAGLEPGNPLRPGIRHRLPGRLDEIAQNWEVTSGGGRETILMIASRRPLEDLEREIRALPRPVPGQAVSYGEVSRRTVRRTLRGIGGLADAAPAPEERPGEGLSGLAASLPQLSDGSRGIWIRRIQLENPGP